MEMIDVLKKLEDIAQTKPELVADAVANVQKTNPAEVKEENDFEYLEIFSNLDNSGTKLA